MISRQPAISPFRWLTSMATVARGLANGRACDPRQADRSSIETAAVSTNPQNRVGSLEQMKNDHLKKVEIDNDGFYRSAVRLGN
jgi:hypothetical protein